MTKEAPKSKLILNPFWAAAVVAPRALAVIDPLAVRPPSTVGGRSITTSDSSM